MPLVEEATVEEKEKRFRRKSHPHMVEAGLVEEMGEGVSEAVGKEEEVREAEKERQWDRKSRPRTEVDKVEVTEVDKAEMKGEDKVEATEAEMKEVDLEAERERR